MMLFFVGFVTLPLYLPETFNFTESKTGFFMAFISLVTIIVASQMPKLVKLLGEGKTIALGFLFFMLGYFVLATTSSELFLIRFQNDGFLKQDLNQKRVFQFLELMETSFLTEITTDYYAEQIGISSKRLNQILKEKLNRTAKQIIQQRQITEAKRRLVKGEINTKELAFYLGFDSLSSFSRFFKKNVGVSPSVFKEEH